MLQKFAGPLLIALAAATATLTTIAPDGNGPGVACDELYHVYQGKQLVAALREQGLAFFLPANIERNFSWKPGGPPVQAPLGYWILGWTHHLFDPAPNDPTVVSIPAARFAPAIGFALLVLMVGAWTAQREGRLAGAVAAAAVALTPRLFGHAHLAALDMLTTVFFVAAVLAVTDAARRGRIWQFALAGVVWGAAILVRLHGLLIVPPVVLWLLWRSFFHKPTGCNPWAWRSVKPALLSFCGVLTAWLGAGAATFLAGWPWLWLAPIMRFQQYLTSGTGRQSLHVFYAGQVWADRDVPWHYPWVTFAATLPLGFLVLGLVGLWANLFTKSKDDNAGNFRLPEAAGAPEGVLLAGTIGFVLLVFSWPGTPVYDGERLFLMVFPLWAVWVGIGARRLWCLSDALHQHRTPTHCNGGALGNGIMLMETGRGYCAKALVLLFVALQGIGLVLYHPCHLSHYSLLVGGLAGAERLGFEATYWGDTVREPMLAEAACLSRGEPVLLAPNLAPFQAPAVEITSPALRKAGVSLIGWDSSNPQAAKNCRYAVIYHRRADLADVERIQGQGRVVMEYENQGVWLARLIELAPR
jgi:4-amino-4-deoxy-L-arabinose transferase-like glycosyltransferase